MQDDLNLDMSRTYIYEGNEYILTGRTAEKTSDTTSSSTRPRRSTRRRRAPEPPVDEKDMMVEIKPAPRGVNRPPMGMTSESKWVRFSELYMVVNLLEDEYDDDDEVDIDDIDMDDIDIPDEDDI